MYVCVCEVARRCHRNGYPLQCLCAHWLEEKDLAKKSKSKKNIYTKQRQKESVDDSGIEAMLCTVTPCTADRRADMSSCS